jgi:hypothetical protein
VNASRGRARANGGGSRRVGGLIGLGGGCDGRGMVVEEDGLIALPPEGVSSSWKSINSLVGF